MATIKKSANEADLSNGSSTTKTGLITVKPAQYEVASFDIVGEEDVPLVIHRFSAKLKAQMRDKMITGKAAGNRKNREPKDMDQVYEDARYRSRDGGWDGFHAAALRNGMISACRLVGFKMTIAKMSVFILKDGVDRDEPQIPLIHIQDCEPVKQEDMARVETGQPYVTVRAAYHNWRARVRVRWDADQFTLNDVTNLLVRVGQQVGIGEGRPDSKNSAGMGWGLFNVAAVAV